MLTAVPTPSQQTHTQIYNIYTNIILYIIKYHGTGCGDMYTHSTCVTAIKRLIANFSSQHYLKYLLLLFFSFFPLGVSSSINKLSEVCFIIGIDVYIITLATQRYYCCNTNITYSRWTMKRCTMNSRMTLRFLQDVEQFVIHLTLISYMLRHWLTIIKIPVFIQKVQYISKKSEDEDRMIFFCIYNIKNENSRKCLLLYYYYYHYSRCPPSMSLQWNYFLLLTILDFNLRSSLWGKNLFILLNGKQVSSKVDFLRATKCNMRGKKLVEREECVELLFSPW